MKKIKKIIDEIICFVLICFSFCMVSCDRKAEKDKVENIEISSELTDGVWNVGDVINYSEYVITVFYESGAIRTISFSDINYIPVDTLSAGEKILKIKYENFEKDFVVKVEEIKVVNATYKGENLTFYIGEELELTGLTFTVLYSNGDESIKNLSEATFDSVDYTLTGNDKTLEFTYEKVKFNVSYKVEYRPLINSNEYNFIDEVGIINMDVNMVVFNDGVFSFYYSEGGVKDDRGVLSTSSCGYNRYIATRPVGGVPTSVEFHLIGNTVYLTLHQA